MKNHRGAVNTENMETQTLLLFCYNHLPETTNATIFEQYYQYCYRPFLSVLNRFPEIHVAVFYSGTLLAMLESKHPEFLLLLNEMISNKQVELLGGSYNCAYLPAQTNSERIAGIEMLTNYTRKKFSKRPRGFWMPDYLWSNSLIGSLVNCGFEYAVHKCREPNTFDSRSNMFITEENYKPIKIIKAIDSLQYDDKLVHEILNEIRDLQMHPKALAFRGESLRRQYEKYKFESPDVMMEKTFAWFRKNILQYDSALPGKLCRSGDFPATRAYFPDYIPNRTSDFLSSNKSAETFLDLFLENRDLVYFYAKMNFVRLLLRNEVKGDKERKRAGIDALSMATPSDMFDPENGFMQRDIRLSCWKHLIDAEKCTNGKKNLKTFISEQDYDLDGNLEIIIRQKNYDCVADTQKASILELDYMPLSLNLCSIFSKDKNDFGLFIDTLHQGKTKVNPIYKLQETDYERCLVNYKSIIDDTVLAKKIQFTSAYIRV